MMVPLGTVDRVDLNAEAVARPESIEVETLALIDVEIGSLVLIGIEEVPAGTVIWVDEAELGLIAVSVVDITIEIQTIDLDVLNVV